MTSGSEDFTSASLNALEAIEAPCDLIFNRESRLIQDKPSAPPEDSAAPLLHPTSHTDPAVPPHASSRSSRTRGLARAPPPPPKRLLFIRNTATSPPEIAKLACAQCARSDFSNLQGLLNHCRLRHQVEYGSHDECVQSCAVLVPDAERDWVVANGVELAGISLPSLKRLFEIAVGAGGRANLPTFANQAPPVILKAEPTEAPEIPSSNQPSEDHPPAPSSEPSALVTRTLGLHADTPALAPFLGKTFKRRCINVRGDEDDYVNIELSLDGLIPQCKKTWRKPYTHRNVARKELDEVPPLPEHTPTAAKEKMDEQVHHEASTDVVASLQERSSLTPGLLGTRFHMTARVQVADYSLYVPPSKR